MLKKHTHRISLLAITGVALLVMMLVTNPEDVGPTGVTVFFFISYVFCFLLANILTHKWMGRSTAESTTTQFILNAILAGVIPLVLALQTLGQLQVRDFLIVIALIFLVVFYGSQRRK